MLYFELRNRREAMRQQTVNDIKEKKLTHQEIVDAYKDYTDHSFYEQMIIDGKLLAKFENYFAANNTSVVALSQFLESKKYRVTNKEMDVFFDTDVRNKTSKH